ncbi:hypothetical protein ACHAWF_011815, partial [Thalassiosira exigua]
MVYRQRDDRLDLRPPRAPRDLVQLAVQLVRLVEHLPLGAVVVRVPLPRHVLDGALDARSREGVVRLLPLFRPGSARGDPPEVLSDAEEAFPEEVAGARDGRLSYHLLRDAQLLEGEGSGVDVGQQPREEVVRARLGGKLSLEVRVDVVVDRMAVEREAPAHVGLAEELGRLPYVGGSHDHRPPSLPAVQLLLVHGRLPDLPLGREGLHELQPLGLRDVLGRVEFHQVRVVALPQRLLHRPLVGHVRVPEERDVVGSHRLIQHHVPKQREGIEQRQERVGIPSVEPPVRRHVRQGVAHDALGVGREPPSPRADPRREGGAAEEGRRLAEEGVEHRREEDRGRPHDEEDAVGRSPGGQGGEAEEGDRRGRAASASAAPSAPASAREEGADAREGVREGEAEESRARRGGLVVVVEVVGVPGRRGGRRSPSSASGRRRRRGASISAAADEAARAAVAGAGSALLARGARGHGVCVDVREHRVGRAGGTGDGGGADRAGR